MHQLALMVRNPQREGRIGIKKVVLHGAPLQSVFVSWGDGQSLEAPSHCDDTVLIPNNPCCTQNSVLNRHVS